MQTEESTSREQHERLTQRDAFILQLHGLTKRYGARTAVDGVDLGVRTGEVFGFLGPNGAGKTTTIRMCLGLIAPSAGRVEILGYDVAREPARALPHVGALIEQPALYNHLSGRNNLRVVADAQGGVSEAHLDAALELVGLRGRDRDRVRTYSLGMRQRLGVAMALLLDPELVVLDEPTNGLDPAGIVEMRDLLRSLAAQGKAIFVSSHLLGEMQQTCDRVAIINSGRLITVAAIGDLTQGKGEFAVRVDRATEALSLLQRETWGQQARLDEAGQRVLTGAPNGDGGALNRFLLQAGFTPEQITPYEENLEDIFLRLTTSEHTPLYQTTHTKGMTR